MCNSVAPRLVDVEKQATDAGVNWVMLDVNEPANDEFLADYDVNRLPHFEFLAADGLRSGKPIKGCAKRECGSANIQKRLGALSPDIEVSTEIQLPSARDRLFGG
mmetsp:Transcript_4539/g.6400  ORF Transcript_4539/g.6400 Transcript_4539/m.6400 type:complete len:105 (+) Transcript_4539:215-529(+)